MNFKQLTAFREVMLTGSVSEAARNLYRTQPAISALIAGLEKDIGVKLFVRKGARVHPNPEAHYLFDEASQILNQLETVKKTLENISDLASGEIRIVSIPGPSAFFLPNLISQFVEGKPKIEITVGSRTSIQVQRLIANQQFDVGLADFGSGAAVDSRLVHHEIFNFEGLCAVNADDPLAKKDVITASDLSGRPMALPEQNHPIHAQIRTAFNSAGASLDIRFKSLTFLTMFTFIERGLACAIIDPISAESYHLYKRDPHPIVFRPFKPVVKILTSIMSPTHRPLSNVAQAFHHNLITETNRIRDKWNKQIF